MGTSSQVLMTTRANNSPLRDVKVNSRQGLLTIILVDE